MTSQGSNDQILKEAISQNENLKKALYQTKNLLDEKNNDLKINKEIVEDQKKRLDATAEDYRQIEAKYWRSVEEKELVEKHAKEDFSKLQDLLARKERETMEMKSKYLNYIDFELEQKKIENKLELKYGRELEEKQRLIDALNKEINELMRENEISKAKLSTIQRDQEDSTKLIKDSHKKQIDLLMAEINDYQNAKVFDDYKPKYDEMKVKKEEQERINEQIENEMHNLKAELHNVRFKYNQVVVDNTREMDRVRSEGWNFKNEKEKLMIKNESLEKENAELRDKFSDYEKRIVDMTNEMVDKNKIILQKEREAEELLSKLIGMENESVNKQRNMKQVYEDQANSTRMQHTNDLKAQQEEIRILKENVNRLEDRIKNGLSNDQNKDKAILDLERKCNDYQDNINRLSRVIKEERDKSDRIALENEGR